MVIEELSAETLREALPELTEILEGCVAEGASIGFLLPMPAGEGEAYWRGLEGAVRQGTRRILVVRREGRIVATGALALGALPNARHRAEVSKLLVHPAARRQGLARALLAALEAMARQMGLRLLVLDTKPGDAGEPLYRATGWIPCGTIPGYVLDDGGRSVSSTLFFYKPLSD